MLQNQLLFSPKIESLLVSNITIHLITQDRPQGIILASFPFLPPFYKSDRLCLLPLFMKCFHTLYPSMPACTAKMKTLLTLRNTSWRFRQEGPFPWVLVLEQVPLTNTEACGRTQWLSHRMWCSALAIVNLRSQTSTHMTNTAQAPGKHFSISPLHISFAQTKGRIWRPLKMTVVSSPI